jgi:Spy/CpxP family protein refolding chaperone
MNQFTLTLSIAAAALFAIQSTTVAQDPPAAGNPPPAEGGARPGGGRRMDPEARMKIMTEKLGLSAEQQTQIKAVIEKNAAKLKELMAKGWQNLTDEDKAAMRDSFKAQMTEIEAILTPEQQAKMKELLPQRRGGAKPDAAK